MKAKVIATGEVVNVVRIARGGGVRVEYGRVLAGGKDYYDERSGIGYMASELEFDKELPRWHKMADNVGIPPLHAPFVTGDGRRLVVRDYYILIADLDNLPLEK